MALINITPVMTSNTTPSPYVVSVSSTNGTYYPWKALDGVVGDAFDCWLANTVTGFLVFDFSTATKVNAISITARNDTVTYQDTAPKEFFIYGSNDNSTFDLIDSYSSQILWLANESRLFKFKTQVQYRYYKILISNNNGHASACGFSLLKFLQDDGVIIPITNTQASMEYCLGQNSTSAMLQKRNDYREGLLGFANDGANYGTLYMINHTGKADIPMTRMMNPDILFDGSANAIGIYNISGSFPNYKYLLFKMSTNNCMVTQLLKVSDFISTTSSKVFVMEVCASSTTIAGMSLYYKTDTSFNVNTVSLSGYSSIYIEKIYGIK